MAETHGMDAYVKRDHEEFDILFLLARQRNAINGTIDRAIKEIEKGRQAIQAEKMVDTLRLETEIANLMDQIIAARALLQQGRWKSADSSAWVIEREEYLKLCKVLRMTPAADEGA